MYNNQINYALKADILANHQDMLKFENSFRKLAYKRFLAVSKNEEVKNNYIYQDYSNGVVLTPKEADSLFYEYRSNNFEMFDECKKINNSNRKRTKKLKDRVSDYVNKSLSDKSLKVFFLTLTFTDKTLNTTSAQTRRRYVSRYLKSISTGYVANIDFGVENGREHYHAVVITKGKIDFTDWHKLGAINCEAVRLNKTSASKLSKYVNKLVNHAIKETTKRSVILYSKNI